MYVKFCPGYAFHICLWSLDILPSQIVRSINFLTLSCRILISLLLQKVWTFIPTATLHILMLYLFDLIFIVRLYVSHFSF